MNIAIIGGTHGNELVGIEVMKRFEQKRPSNCLHSYRTFLGNPKAYELGRRFVDSDLNRSFGKNGQALGYEITRSKELESEIAGKFDFILDLHTTTSNMGLTIILNRNDQLSFKAACYLKKKFPQLKLITTSVWNEECPYTNAMAPSGLTIEVGPVANNVIKASLVLSVYQMVSDILSWDFEEEFDFSKQEYFQTTDNLHFPAEGNWMIHPALEDHAFKAIKNGDPLFINREGETKLYQGEDEIYPFFINEAAYQKDRIAMSLSLKRMGLPLGE